MNLLNSLLDAIVRLEGDALVMHVGEKPYVVTTSSNLNAYRGPLEWGQVELSSRVLSSEAVLSMVTQLLPSDAQHTLEEFGAIEYHIPPSAESDEHFTLVAARGGDDVWMELRRHRPVAEPPVEEPVAEPIEVDEPVTVPEPVHVTENAEELVLALDEEPERAAQPTEPVVAESLPEPETLIVEVASAEEPVPHTTAFASVPAEAAISDEAIAIELVSAVAEPRADAVAVAAAEESAAEEPPHAEAAWVDVPLGEVASPAFAPEPSAPAAETAAPEPEPEPAEETPPRHERPEPRPALVVPLTRRPPRTEPPAPVGTSAFAIEELLRGAAARGASTVYLVTQSHPLVRADGDINVFDVGTGGPVSESDIDRIVLELAPAAARDVWQRGAPAEWMTDLADVGRVRCLTFRDHRGPGLIFRMIPPQAISADQLGLTAAVQALATLAEGLVLVTGPRASGKSTLLSAFVDLVNRTRSDHVITIESQIGFVHESRHSFVSQREVRGDTEAVLAAVRAALREGPDVLLIEDLRGADVVAAALDAAESGRLVLGSLPAPSTVAAIDRLLDLFPADRRQQVQGTLAGALRGIVAQVLIRRSRGGRIAAREVLLNTAAVAALIQEGNTAQLPVAIESGRRLGMMPLNDSLAALVRDGTVQVADAYRKAFDKEALLAVLKRDGVDTSFAERLA